MDSPTNAGDGSIGEVREGLSLHSHIRHPHHATPADTLIPSCAGESAPSIDGGPQVAMLFAVTSRPLLDRARGAIHPLSTERHLMASPSIQEIASAALQFWDMNADEAESEHALMDAIARDLVEMGVQPETAALAAELADKALDAHEFPDKAVDQAVAEQPLYRAMVAEIQSGGYERIGDLDE